MTVRPGDLVHPLTGETLAPVIEVDAVANILGQPLSTVRAHCAAGVIPTLPRRGNNGRFRIPTAKLLRALGLLVEPSAPSPSSHTFREEGKPPGTAGPPVDRPMASPPDVSAATPTDAPVDGNLLDSAGIAEGLQ